MTRIRGSSRKERTVPLSAHLSHFIVDLHKCVKHLSPNYSPSEVVSSSDRLDEVFGCNNRNIHLGRLGGAPAILFNRILAALQQRLERLDQIPVSRAEVDRAAQYLRCAVKFYDNEKQREAAIRELIDGVIGKTGEWGSFLQTDGGGKIKPDGCWSLDMFFMLLFLELKNSLGLHGDALCQAVVDYSKIVSRDQVRGPVYLLLGIRLFNFVCSTSPSGSTVTFLLFLLDSLQTASRFPSLFAWDRSM